MKSICIFCGSSTGTAKHFYDAAFSAGKFLAEKNIRLIYGGAKVGLMGAVADGALAAGGKVIGVLPYFLRKKEIAHEKLTELICVETMHERKMKMHELSDGAIALPGGFGTMEEMFEDLTWLQLGLHAKPVGVLNHRDFYGPLLALVKNMNFYGFLSIKHLEILHFSEKIDDLIEKMNNWKNPGQEKILQKDQV